jgi:hypothetical protein
VRLFEASADTPRASSVATSSFVDDVVQSISTSSTIPSATDLQRRERKGDDVQRRRRGHDQRVPARRRRAARSLAELVAEGAIRYVPFPPALPANIRSFTEADLARLRAAGYARRCSRRRWCARYIERLISDAGASA